MTKEVTIAPLFEDLAVFMLCFEAKQQISRLPYYHGALWNGLFRDLVRDFVNSKMPMAQTGFRIHPVDTGMLFYNKNDPVHLGISFPYTSLEPVFNMLSHFNSLGKGRGSINPGVLRLEKAVCRVSSTEFRFDADIFSQDLRCIQPLTWDIICRDAQALSAMDQFSLAFYTPLRLKSPGPYREATGNTHIGSDYFRAWPDSAAHLLKASGAEQEACTLSIIRESIAWNDLTYGRHATTIGGITGNICFKGELTNSAACHLVAAQYIGLGKNRTFGFGFFQIPELEAGTAVTPLSRGIRVQDRIFSPASLETALDQLPNSSPGPDGLTSADIKKAGRLFLEKLSRTLLQGQYTPGPCKVYRQKKQNGEFRDIHVFNFTERIVHRAIANFLSPVSETLLSGSCFAYRRGFNREGAAKAVVSALKKGFTTGVKADIRAFFNSVDLQILGSILEGIFPFSGFHELIHDLLKQTGKSGIQGLPQGSPLSPVLSNLYLDRFDKHMIQRGFKLVRYGDDFVALSKQGGSEDHLDVIQEGLKPLGLSLNLEKTVTLDVDTDFTFLGFSISGQQVTEKKKKPEKHDGNPWLPVFREEVIKGYPVYLTTTCRGAYSSGPYMVIQDDNDKTTQVPWHTVSRIVVVGRSSFSSGIVYRAVKEEIPVTFIDIFGRSTGHLTPSSSEIPVHEKLQDIRFSDPKFNLALAREIISAKIHNTHVLLRRNNSPVSALKKLALRAATAENLGQLRGLEGSAARMYFQALQTLVAPFEFNKRVFHPPDSPVNAMLSFGYTLLYNRLATSLRDKGLNPYNGFFHSQGGRHFALASDLMEELRHVIERIVLALIHLKVITPDDFETIQRNSKPFCRIRGEAFRKFIRKYEAAMATEFQYSNTEKISYNAYLDEMADNLVRSMKLDIPFKPVKIR